MTKIRYRRDSDGKLHRVEVFREVEGYYARWTESCTGCLESGEYGGNEHYYHYDTKARCHVGSGCDECGYTGKRRENHWVPFDHDEAMVAIQDEGNL